MLSPPTSIPCVHWRWHQTLTTTTASRCTGIMTTTALPAAATPTALDTVASSSWSCGCCLNSATGKCGRSTRGRTKGNTRHATQASKYKCVWQFALRPVARTPGRRGVQCSISKQQCPRPIDAFFVKGARSVKRRTEFLQKVHAGQEGIVDFAALRCRTSGLCCSAARKHSPQSLHKQTLLDYHRMSITSIIETLPTPGASHCCLLQVVTGTGLRLAVSGWDPACQRVYPLATGCGEPETLLACWAPHTRMPEDTHAGRQDPILTQPVEAPSPSPPATSNSG